MHEREQTNPTVPAVSRISVKIASFDGVYDESRIREKFATRLQRISRTRELTQAIQEFSRVSFGHLFA